MRHPTRTLLALALIASLVACASVSPGQDPVLVRAQQSYQTAMNTCDLVFNLERDHAALVEKAVPGAHAIVNTIKIRALEYLPRLLTAIDVYKAARTQENANTLTTILAVIENLIRQAQDILVKTNAAAPTAFLYLQSAREEALRVV